jgi:hypothetical protein
VTDQTDLFDGIAVARSAWKQTIKSDGGHCPVCDRWGRVYSRRINKTMMKSLIWLHHSSPTDGPWTDIPLTAPTLPPSLSLSPPMFHVKQQSVLLT